MVEELRELIDAVFPLLGSAPSVREVAGHVIEQMVGQHQEGGAGIAHVQQLEHVVKPPGAAHGVVPVEMAQGDSGSLIIEFEQKVTKGESPLDLVAELHRVWSHDDVSESVITKPGQLAPLRPGWEPPASPRNSTL